TEGLSHAIEGLLLRGDQWLGHAVGALGMRTIGLSGDVCWPGRGTTSASARFASFFVRRVSRLAQQPPAVLANRSRLGYHSMMKPREFLEVDPASLHLPSSRRDGADP